MTYAGLPDPRESSYDLTRHMKVHGKERNQVGRSPHTVRRKIEPSI
jgi:hypothetical protein